MSDTAPTQPRPPRRRWRPVAFYGALLALTLAVVSALAAAGRSVTVPPWLQTRIEQRIAEALPQARVEIDAMALVLEEGLSPRVRLRGVSVEPPQGTPIVGFNGVSVVFALRPLLRGALQPRQIALTGVYATLKRDAAGRVSLSAGSGAAPPAREAATLAELIGQADAALGLPVLSALEAVDLRALTLRYEDARAGRAWTVDGGRLRLTRAGDALSLSADLALLGGGAGVATLAASYASTIGETAASFGLSFEGVAAQDIAAQGPAFAWLDARSGQASDGDVRVGSAMSRS